MSSRFRSVAASLLAAAAALAGSALADTAAPRELRVCADPDNLPYSRSDGSGFENRIATLLADEMHATLRYEWLPLRRGFVRKTLGAGQCDLFIGVPQAFERVLTTRPYYRSTYVFVSRADKSIASFDDPRLRGLRIGVQLVGNDLAATPPGHALASRGITSNVTGFTIYGDGPAVERMMHALASNQIDVGIAWGPQAAYFAARIDPSLVIAPVVSPHDPDAIPFAYAMAAGVRRGDTALRDEVDAILQRRGADIDSILAEYGVPRVDAPGEAAR